MDDNSDSVCLQLCIGNKIFKATVTSNAVAEILINKEKSSIVQLMSKGRPESVVVGNFKEKVEIMSVAKMEVVTSNLNNNAEEVMEVEVMCVHFSNVMNVLQSNYDQRFSITRCVSVPNSD